MKNPLVATHDFTYKGKDVLVMVVRLLFGGWIWSYEYDGTHPRINDAEHYPSAHEAIQAGTRAARDAIDDAPTATLH